MNKHEQQAAEQRAREVELEDIAWLMSQPRGRRIMWRLLGIAGIFRSSFTGNSATFFNEGRRDVGLQFLSDVNEIAADDYIRMTQEARNG